MRHNLIKTENYLLVVDDSYDALSYELPPIKNIHAHFPLNGAPVLDIVPVLPSLNQEDEAEEIFPVGKHGVMHMPNRHQLNNSLRQEGYNKAKEKYKYTKEDLVKAIAFGFGVCRKENRAPFDLEQIKFIQSLQQSIPIAFECEMEEKFNCNRQIWTCGCLTESQCKHKERIVKSKTFINSEGRTEWVGKYIYE